jgi:hypothetical protein
MSDKRAAPIQHLIQRQLTILHRISRPETRHEIQREAQRIAQISETPAFLVIKCRRGPGRLIHPQPGCRPRWAAPCTRQHLAEAPLNYPICAPTV